MVRLPSACSSSLCSLKSHKARQTQKHLRWLFNYNAGGAKAICCMGGMTGEIEPFIFFLLKRKVLISKWQTGIPRLETSVSLPSLFFMVKGSTSCSLLCVVWLLLWKALNRCSLMLWLAPQWLWSGWLLGEGVELAHDSNFCRMDVGVSQPVLQPQNVIGWKKKKKEKKRKEIRDSSVIVV